MKKFIFAASLFSLSVSHGAPLSPSSRDTWHSYVGIGEGASLLTPTVQVIDFGSNNTFRDQYTSLFNELFFGVEQKLEDQRFWGGKIFLKRNWLHNSKVVQHPGKFTVAADEAQNCAQTIILEEKYTFGLSANFGMHITKATRLYGGVDLVYTNFELQHSIQPIGAPAINVGTGTQQGLFGIGPKLGVKTSLSQNLDFFLEGSYIFYQPWKSNIIPLANFPLIKRSITPRTMNIAAGIIYNF
jgi:hypothetical protein